MQLNVLSLPQEKDRITTRFHLEAQGTLLTSKGKHFEAQGSSKEKQRREFVGRSLLRRDRTEPGIDQAINGDGERM